MPAWILESACNRTDQHATFNMRNLRQEPRSAAQTHTAWEACLLELEALRCLRHHRLRRADGG
eukprot:11637945-Alexandrium_andersonii.AAC.1